jgi:AcrR family transcriptional regulator
MAAPRNIDTKQLIIDSTSRLIEERNVEAVSLQDIATEAGISKGTLYYYYTSKQLVLLDIIDRYLATLAKDYADWIYNKDKDTSLYRVVYYIISRGVAMGGRAKLHLYFLNHALNDSNMEVRELFKKRYKQWQVNFTVTLATRCSNHEDAELLSSLLLSTIDGLLIQHAVCDMNVDYEKLSHLIVRSFKDQKK